MSGPEITPVPAPTAGGGGRFTGLRDRFSPRRIVLTLGAPLLAVVLSVLLCSLILALVHKPTWGSFDQMIDYGKQGSSVVAIVNEACAYFLSGLAVAIGFRMALFNIGVEGQYQISALLAAAAGSAIHLPAPLDLAIVLLVAMGTGAAWSGIAGVLRATRGVSEVISTIMLNFIATAIIAYLLSSPLREQVSGQLERETAAVKKPGLMPSIDSWLSGLGIKVPFGSSVSGFVVVAIVLGIAAQLLLSRTRFGFELRATGLNPFAALASGVDPKRMVIRTMLLSGAIAGLVGLPQLLGTPPYKYAQSFTTGLGFTGIGIALLGRNNPIGIALGSLLFAFLDRSAQILDLNNTPKEIVTIMQGTIVLAVVVAYEVVRRIGIRQAERSVARAISAGRVLSDEPAADSGAVA